MKKRLLTSLEVKVMKTVYPINSIISYGNGSYQTKRKSVLPGIRNDYKRSRGVIKKMRNKSLQRLMMLVQCTQAKFMSMFTQTYPKFYPRDGLVVKKDIAALSAKFARIQVPYLWFLEFTEKNRRAPHVHWLLELDCITPRTRMEIGLFWATRVLESEYFRSDCPLENFDKEGMKVIKVNVHPETFSVLRSEEGARNYVMKYAAKERQKKVPNDYKNVGRFWGASQGVAPTGVESDITEDEVEAWLCKNDHPTTAYELVPRYLWQVGTLHREYET